MHYYNEHNAYRAAVLRERMEEGLLPKGVVDERNIEIVPDEDFLGYTQIHLFAGIGGFPLGMRRAGFPEHVRIVDGGFPCQDISNAGKRAGITGSRSRLWREMVRCIRVVRPDLVFVENVAALLCRGMGDVLGDLAEIGYDAEGDCISAADVGAPHLRRRIWIVAHDARARSRRLPVFAGESRQADTDLDGISAAVLADASGARCDGRTRKEQPVCGRSLLPARSSGCSEIPDDDAERQQIVQRQRAAAEPSRGFESDSENRWPVEPDVGRVANGIPRRVDRLAALGDAIVPACVEEMIRRTFRQS